MSLWRRFRDLSISKYEQTYARLNVRFDSFAGESLVPEESIRRVVQQLGDMGLLVKKTKAESKNDWEARRKAGLLGKNSEPAIEELADAEDTTDLADAIDLKVYNLGKPVVRKAGACFLGLSLSELSRRYDHLHCSRYRWCDRTF